MKVRSREKPKILVIQGPTGIGKTAIALRLSRHFPVEIINADSMQFYRHMDIGTAKPTRQERERIPHHMLDVVNPDEPF
ncbi:MAG: isopentenyl transferase family protein, partial [Pseudomonadota bacterium]